MRWHFGVTLESGWRVAELPTLGGVRTLNFA